jgi:hypothetical protein
LYCLTAVSWQNQDCKLTLHYDNGFTLAENPVTNEDNNLNRKTHVLWHYPYEKLRMSADDGVRLLWLDFGEEGEQVSLLITTVNGHRLYVQSKINVICHFKKRIFLCNFWSTSLNDVSRLDLQLDLWSNGLLTS